MLNNSIKEKIKNDEPVFGSFVKIYSPAMVEIMGQAGFDFIILDTEHYYMTHEQVENMVRAADINKMCTIVRVQDATEPTILHALDSGASGIQVPSLRTPEEASEVIKNSKYYPIGERGWGNGTRAGNYAFTPASEYIKYANENSLVVIHVENVDMLEQIDKLCQIPYVDVVFVGPGDLSQSMGKPGQISDPEVVANVEKVIKTAKKYGKGAGTFVASEESMKHFMELGARYFAWKSDITLYTGAIRGASKIFESLK